MVVALSIALEDTASCRMLGRDMERETELSGQQPSPLGATQMMKLGVRALAWDQDSVAPAASA